MNVFVVEHNRAQQDRLAACVESLQGSRVRRFAGAHEALAWCVLTPPALVLANACLPDIGGLEFLRRLRGRAPGAEEGIAVMLLTPAADSGLRAACIEAGAEEAIGLPVEDAELAARLRALLARRSRDIELTGRARWLAARHAESHAELASRDMQVLAHLRQAVELRDPQTAFHMLRMAHYARLIAQRMGMSHEEQEIILAAAGLHDLGKVGLPDAILKKQGMLDEDEQALMRTHVHHGYAILRHGTSPLVQAAAEIALNHHEKFDGSGYPEGKRGAEIPLRARISAVADVFDALISPRPHRPAFELDCAFDHLRAHSGRHFDPDCVQAFLEEAPRVQDIRTRFPDGGATRHLRLVSAA